MDLTEARVSAGLTKRCPICGARASADNRFCEADGTELIADNPVNGASPGDLAPGPTAAGTCPCGQAIDDGEGYCSACGHRIRLPRAQKDRAVTVLSPTIAGVTDRGHRHPVNEDALAMATEIVAGENAMVLVVCDGVSSSQDADQAARRAAATASDALRTAVRVEGADLSQAMSDAIGRAHRAVCGNATPAIGAKDPAGTTIVAAVAVGGRVVVGWVGDSRAYWLAPSGAARLTHDHSWAEEIIASGVMTAADAYRDPRAHAITHCLGPLEAVDGGAGPVPGIATFAPPPDCWLILCTDGFWNGAPDPSDVARLFAEAPSAEAQARAEFLVDHALDRGGVDNITVVVARLTT